MDQLNFILLHLSLGNGKKLQQSLSLSYLYNWKQFLEREREGKQVGAAKRDNYPDSEKTTLEPQNAAKTSISEDQDLLPQKTQIISLWWVPKATYIL